MKSLLAARMGDEVGNHSSGLLAGLGMGLGLLAGALIGAALVVAVVATGGAVLVVAAAVAGAVCITAASGAAGERLGEAYDNDAASGTPCSTILMGLLTVKIENRFAARLSDPTTPCLITKSPAILNQGSKTVFMGRKNAARHNDKATCTGLNIPQTLHTFIGGAPATGGAPFQSTTASFFHDMGSGLEETAKWSGYAALALGGAAVAAVGVTAGLAASAGGAGLAASVGAGTMAAAPGALGLGLGYAGSIGGAKGGAAVGGLIDGAAGYKDGRFSQFGSTWGSIAGGVAGGKVAEVGIEVGGKMARGGPGEEGVTDPAGKTDTPTDDVAKAAEPLEEDDGCPTCDDEKAKPKTEEPPKDPSELTPRAKAVVDALPKALQDDVALSPKLRQQINDLVNRGNKAWDIQTDPAKAGADANRQARMISMGSGYDDVRVLAHEVGHALYDPPPVAAPDVVNGTKAGYVDKVLQGNLYDEGEARFNEFDVRQDILDHGGKDIGNWSNDQTGQDLYNQYKSGKITREQAVEQMGQGFKTAKTSTTGQTYEEYYGKWAENYWDQVEAAAKAAKNNTVPDTVPRAPAPGKDDCPTCGGDVPPKASEEVVRATSAETVAESVTRETAAAEQAETVDCPTCGNDAKAPPAHPDEAQLEAMRGKLSEKDYNKKVQELQRIRAAGKKLGLSEDATPDEIVHAAQKALANANRQNYEAVQSGDAEHPAGVIAERLKLAVEGGDDGVRVPLTYKGANGDVNDVAGARQQFDEFSGGIGKIMEDNGLTDATVQQLGSGTTGWKNNPMKYINYLSDGEPGTSWFDAGAWTPGSDTDLSVFSAQGVDMAKASGVPTNDAYGIFKTGKPGEAPGFSNTDVGKSLYDYGQAWDSKLYSPDALSAAGGEGLVDSKLNIGTQPFEPGPEVVPIYKGPAAGGGSP